MKRKKIYRPKKCYVRIQIPRKGYFYRSTVGLQNPESSPSNCGKTKVDPKSEISDLAPSRSKAASLPNEKILKKQSGTEHLNPEPFDIFTPEYLEELLGELHDQAFTDDFNKWVNEYVTLNWPENGFESSFRDVLVDFDNIRAGGETQRSAISENLNSQTSKNDNKAPKTQPESTWNAFLDCINAALGKEKFIYNLEVTQMNGSPFKDAVLQSIQEEQMPEDVETGETSTFCSPHNEYDTPSLMSGVDLHLELQNYIKAIETCHGTKSRTKNTLQCNFYDNYIPLQIYSSSQELQNRVDEFFDVTENKSGSSFDSATSTCQQLEEVTNEVFHDVIPGSHEFVFDETRMNSDTEKESKNPIKRKGGKKPMLKLHDKTTWESTHSTKHSGGDAGDDYEKIQPIGVTSTGRKTGSKLLLLNATPETVQNLSSEHPSIEGRTPVWSPTLQELIEIYNIVLKKNKKIQTTNNSIPRRFSTHLSSFLNENVNCKEYKDKLMNLSKDLTVKRKPKNGRKSKNDMVTIEEYVAMFQEVLQSSLSINQIARINNIISGLQDYSEKNYNYLKDLDDEFKNLSKESISEQTTEEPPSPPHVKSKKEKPVYEPPPKSKISNKSKTPQKQGTPTPPKQTESKRSQTIPTPRPKSQSSENSNKTEPTELDSILKLCFMEGGILKKPETADNKKVLVSVKLLGNQVLVNGVSFFSNENTLENAKQELNGTSELIIENVTNTQMNGIWWKNNKSSRLRMENQEKKHNKNPRKTTKGRRKKWRSKTEQPNSQDTVTQRTENKTHFEYDQVQLRAQHPIEVIAETSESKLSQTADNSEEEHWKDPPPETKILLQDIPPNPKAMKEALRAALNQKVFSKNLTCGFRWSEVEMGKNRDRITRKPALKSKSQTKPQPTPKKHKCAVMVRSMVDLKKKPKIRKTQTHRPHSTYLCYSSMQNCTGKGNKKPQRGSIHWKSDTVFKPKPPEKRKVSGKESKETWPKPKKVEHPPTSDSGARSTQETSPERFPGAKSSSDTVSSMDNCELELLFQENEKHEESPAYVNSVASIQKEPSISSTDSKKKESSIALLPPTNCNDCISFLVEMIHSDSFLNNFPKTISQGKLNMFSGPDTDLKFYPGRLIDGGNSEEKPLVTFVLTPSQHKLAELPENQVTVVKKDHACVCDENENPKMSPFERKEGRDEVTLVTLRSIEDFITYLSKSTKAAKKKANAGNKKKQDTVKRSKERPNPVPEVSGTETSAQVPRKPLQVNQQRKLPETSKKKPEKPEVVGNNPKTKKKGELGTTVLDLDMLVNSLTRLVDNLKGKNTGGSPKSDDSKTVRENADTERSQREEVPPEVIGMVQAALSMAKSSAKRKQKPKIGVPMKSKAVKIKIHQNDQKQKKQQKRQQNEANETGNSRQEEVKPKQNGESNLLDSLLSQNVDLKKSSSTYFDAVGIIGDGEQMTNDSNCINQTTAEGDNKSGAAEDQDIIFTPSDNKLFSKNIIGKESEDKLFQKISKSLREGQMSYSLALLEGFLYKSDNSNSKLVTLVESKTKDEMLKMERAAWLKVILLLQEVTQVLKNNDKKQPKQFSEILNPSQQDNRNMMNRIKQSLNIFKQKFNLSGDSSQNLDNPEPTGSERVIEIHSANTETPEADTKQENERELEEVKKNLRQQYASLQQLIEDEECVPEEIRDVRKTVTEKMKEMVKVLEVHDAWEASSRVANCWNRVTSLLLLAKSYRKAGGGASGSGLQRTDAPVGLKLDRRPGYVDLIRGLIKVWDTRMTINAITGDCFR